MSHAAMNDPIAKQETPALALAQGSAPSLPATMSRDGSELWQWAGDMGAWIQREARIAELRAEIKKCGQECGDCDKWMKSRECPREQPGTDKRSGYSVGPSMSAPICNAYVEKYSTTQRRAKLTSELETLLPPNVASETRGPLAPNAESGQSPRCL